MKRKSRKLPKSVRPEEWDKLVKQIRGDKVAMVAFLLAYGAGMRISEVLKCEKSHFQSDGMIWIGDYAKYGVERKVPIPKGWRETFFSQLPMPVGERTLQRRFKHYASKAGLNPLYTFHSLRHGFATRLLEGGTPINIVSLALGHSDISTTGIYTKASPTDLIKYYQENF